MVTTDKLNKLMTLTKERGIMTGEIVEDINKFQEGLKNPKNRDWLYDKLKSKGSNLKRDVYDNIFVGIYPQEVEPESNVVESVTEQPAQSSAMLQDIITPVERKPAVAESTNVALPTLEPISMPNALDDSKDYSSMSIEDLSKEFAPLQDEYNKAKSAFGAYKEEITPAFEKEKSKHTMQGSSFAQVRGGAYVPTGETLSIDEYGTRDANYQKLKTAESDAAIQLTSSPAYKEFASRQVKDLEKKRQELQSFMDDKDDKRLKERIKLQMSGTKEDKEKDLEYARKEANVEAQIAFIDKTIQALQAPTKEDNSWWLANVYRGAKDNATAMLGTIGDVFTGFSDIRNNLAVADALKKVASLGEEATPEAIDKALTKEEKDMLIQWEQMNETKQLVAPNMSVGYQVGEGFATSTGFMLDFFLTRGATNAISAPAKKAVMNAFGKWLTSNAVKGSKAASNVIRGTGKTAAWATDATLSTAARTPLMSSTYENITERMTEFDENGKPRSTMDALALGISDALIENFSETSGAMIGGLGNALLKKPLQKSFGTLLSKMGASGKGVKAFADEIKEFKKIIEKGGYHGYSEEFLEEVFGTILTEARGLTGIDPNDKQAWEEFWEPENLNVLLQSLAVPMLPSMVNGTAKGIKEYKQALPVGDGNAPATMPENSVQLPDNNLQAPMPATYDLGDGNVLQGTIIGDYTIEDGKLQGNPIFQHEENGQVVTTKLEDKFFDRVSFEQPQEQEYTNKTGTFNDYIDDTQTEETDGLVLDEEFTDADIDAMIDEFESQEIANEQVEGQTEEQTEEQADEETQTAETEVAEQVNTPIQEEQGQTEGQTEEQPAPVNMESENPMFEMIRQADSIGVPFTSVIEKQEKKLNKLKESLADNFNQENIKKVQEQMAIVEEYKRVYAEYQSANQPSAQVTEQVTEQAPTQVQAVESEPVTIPNAETNAVEQPIATTTEQPTEQAPEQTETQPTEQQVESIQEEELPTEEPEDVQQVRNTLATNAVLTALKKAGVKVVHATQDMVDAVLGKEGVEFMGSRVNKRMADIEQHFSNSELTDEQRAIVDVFSGEQDNLPIEVQLADGTTRRVLLRQGNENKAGTKHVLFRHYETQSSPIEADDILLIPNIIANGKRTEKKDGNKNLVEYKYTDSNGIIYLFITEYVDRAEKFVTYYTNRKGGNSHSFNTHLSAQAGNTTSSASKGTTNNLNNKINFLRSADGTIYGWIENGTIYLTEEGMNPNTPIHEYTHLWARCIKSLYPEKWNQIKATLKECKELWDAVVNDSAYEDIKENEDAIASEVLARYSGEFGEQRMLEAVASITKEDADSIITKAKKVLSEFWNQVKAIFYSLGTKDFERSDFSDIDKISSTILRDLLLGKNPAQILADANLKQAQEQIRQDPMNFAITDTGIDSLNDELRFEDEVLSLPKPINQCTKEELVQFIAKSADNLNAIDSCIDKLTDELIVIGSEEQTNVSYHDYNRINNVVKYLQAKKKAINDSMEFVMQRGGITPYDLAEQKQDANQVAQEPIAQYEKEQGANQDHLDINAIEEVGQVVEEGEPSTDKKTKGLRLGRFEAIWNKDIQGMPFNKLVRLKGGASYKGRYVGENENGEAVYQVVKPHLSFKKKGKFVYINNAEGVEDLSEGYVFVDANGNISESQENTTRKKVYFVNNKETDRFTQAHMEDSAENKRISYTNIYDENNKPLRKKAEKVLWERTEEQLYGYIENYADKKIAEEKENGFEFTDQDARYYHYLLNKAKKIYDYAVKLYNEDDKDFGESGASRTQKQSFLENAKTILGLVNKEVENFKKSGIEKQLQECEDEEKKLDAIMPLISQEEIIQGTHEQRSSLYKWLKMIGVKVHNLSAEDFADKLDKFQNTADFHLAKSMQGDVYGFVYRGQIYINQDIAGSEVYVHEYSHIWIQSLKKLNPKLYMRGVELVRQMPEYETLRNAILSTYEEETPTSEQITKADEWACEELLATVMGKKGAERINQIAESGDTFVGLARRIKQWIIDAYNSLKSIMDDFTDKELNSLTVESFSDMMLKDLSNLVDMKSPSVREEVKTIDAQKARMEDIKRRFLDYVGGVESGSLDTAYGLARAQLRFIIKEIRNIQPQRSNKIPLSACREIYKQLLVASKTNFRNGEVKSNTYTKPLMEAYCNLLTLFNNIENTNIEIAQSKADKTFNRAIQGTKKQDIKRGGVMSYTYADTVMSLREQSEEELLDGTNTTLTNNKRSELNDKFDKLAEEIKDLQEQLNNATVESKGETERKIREKQMSYNMLAVEDLAITAQEERCKVAIAEAQMSEHIKRIDDLREQIKQDQRSRSTIQSEVVVNAQQEASNKYSINILNKRIKEANEEIRYIEYLMSVTSQEILEHNNKQLIACNAILDAGRSDYHAMVYKRAKEKAEFLAGAINDVEVRNGKQVSKLRDNINNVVQKTLGSLDYLIDRISVNALKGNSFLRKHFLDEYNKKNSEYIKQMQDHMNMLDAKIAEIFKGVAGKKIKKVENINDLSYLLNEVLFGKKIEYDVPRADEEEPEHVVLELNMSQAMEIYLQARQEDGRKALKKGGITDDIIDEIVSRFDEPSMVAYKEWADYMQLELLPSLKERFNKRYREQFFIDIPLVENYFPIKAKLSTTDELLKSLSSSEYRFNASTVANNLYARSHNSAIELRDVDINPANVLAQYLCNMEHWYHMSELQEKTNWLVNSGKFQRLLKQQGESTRKHFNQSLIYTVSNTDSHSKIGNFVSMYQLGMVGFRGMTAIKQLASIPAFFIYATNKYVRNEMALNASPHRLFGRIERAKELFPTIKERIESGSLGSELLLDFEDSGNLKWRKVKRGASRTALWANRRIDIYVVANGTLAVYDGMVKQKLSEGRSQAEAEAIAYAYAMNAFEATQQSSNRAYLAPFQQDRSWSLITGFQNAPYAYARRFVEMSRFFKDWTSGAYKEQIENTIKYYVEFEGFSEERARQLAYNDFKRSRISAFNTLAGLGLSSLLFKYGIPGFVQWLLGYDGDDDEDNEKRLLSIYTEWILNATGGVLLEGLAYGNTMTDLINQVIKGEKIRPINLLGLLKPATEGAVGIAEGVSYFFDEDKERSEAWFKLIHAIGNISPFPMDATTASKIIVGIKDMFTNYPNKEEFWIGFLNFMNLPTSQMANILQAVEGYDSNREASEDPRYINAYNWASRLWEYIK